VLRRNISLPSSGMKNKQHKKAAAAGSKMRFFFVNCQLIYLFSDWNFTRWLPHGISVPCCRMIYKCLIGIKCLCGCEVFTAVTMKNVIFSTAGRHCITTKKMSTLK
jgi:hypothetical protein